MFCFSYFVASIAFPHLKKSLAEIITCDDDLYCESDQWAFYSALLVSKLTKLVFEQAKLWICCFEGSELAFIGFL